MNYRTIIFNFFFRSDFLFHYFVIGAVLFPCMVCAQSGRMSRNNVVKGNMDILSQVWNNNSNTNFMGLGMSYERALFGNNFSYGIMAEYLFGGDVIISDIPEITGILKYYFKKPLEGPFAAGNIFVGIPKTGMYYGANAVGGYQINIHAAFKLEFHGGFGYGKYQVKGSALNGFNFTGGLSAGYKFVW